MNNKTVHVLLGLILVVLLADLVVDTAWYFREERGGDAVEISENKYHGVSYATENTSPEQAVVELPEPGETYEVVGTVQGLNKFVVRYDDNFIRGGEPIAKEGMETLKEIDRKSTRLNSSHYS